MGVPVPAADPTVYTAGVLFPVRQIPMEALTYRHVELPQHCALSTRRSAPASSVANAEDCAPPMVTGLSFHPMPAA